MSKKMMIIQTKGSLDMAYPCLILSTTAAALDIESTIFFTFYGLDIINKHKYNKLKVSMMGNPGMPMPQSIADTVGVLPFMRHMATSMMEGMFAKVKVQTIPELVELALQSGVKLYACQMTMDAMGVHRNDLIDGVEEPVGAATALDMAIDANVHWSF